MSERVFVYGSLKKGLEHHDQMAGAESLGEGSVKGYALVLYEESYPALVRAPGELIVVGELYAVSADHLVRLDAFEDCPELYQRARVELVGGEFAWTYIITDERGVRYPRIEGPWQGR